MDSTGLSLTCAGLGFPEEDEGGAVIGYTKSEHCLDNLKDLQRFLRRDDPEQREVFKQICKWNISSRDLVPIIEHYQTDRNLVITAVKVLVFLTMPVEPSSNDVVQQLEYLWDLKAALTRNVAIAVIVSLLENPLDHLERTSFTEDDWKLVQLVLTLFRNILAIQEITLPQKAAGAATQLLRLADDFLELMFQENVMDLILVLTHQVDEPSGYLKQENLLLLEIFHYLFSGRNPELIAKAYVKGAKVDGDVDTSVRSLRSMMEEEEKRKKMLRLRNSGRPSLSGTFTCLSSDGSKTLCKGNPGSASANSLLKIRNVQRGPQKRVAWDNEILYLPKEGITEMLRNFLNQFLSGGYNVLMQSICNDIIMEHHSVQKSDIATFFKVARFVLAFQHEKAASTKKSNLDGQSPRASPSNEHTDNLPFHGDICGPVAATLNEDMFNVVISRWRETYDGLKETNDYKTLSAAGSLMKNMFCMIYLVLKVLPEDSRESQTARVLLYKLFYDQTEQGLTQFLLNLFRSFDTHKQPKSDLADLLETIHIMLQLMERLQARGALRVAKRARNGRKKKKSNDCIETEKPRAENVESNKVDQTDGDKCLPESLPDLRTEENPVPEEPSFVEHGDVNSNGRYVPDTVLGTTVPLEGTMQLGGEPSSAGRGEMERDLIVEEEDETSDSSMDDHPPATSEVDFNVSRLISSFANNSALQNICWLLKHYKSNSFRTNHYILCMLRRFCEDLEMSPMLYQLSLLSTFYDILADQKSLGSKEYANIVNFLSKVVRKMLKLMKKQPLLFVDILFWKTRKDCHCINADALMSDLANLKKDIRNLGDGEFVPSRDRWRGPISIADSLGDDEADLVVLHTPYNADKDDDSSSGDHEDDIQKSSDAANKRNTVSRDSQNLEVPKRRGRPLFNQEQEKLIRDLYEKYKDDRKCSHLIADALDPDGKISSAQVSRKLTQLGLRKVMRRTKVSEAPLSAGDLAAESQNDLLNDPNHMSGEHGCSSMLESSRHKRKKLHRLSGNLDEVITHEASSDEDTLQVIKSRSRKKNKLPMEGLALSLSLHQEALQSQESDGETIGNMLRSGKNKGSLMSDFAANVREHQEPLRNKSSDGEPSAPIDIDTTLRHGASSLRDSGHDGNAELLDDFLESELDTPTDTEQGSIDNRNVAELMDSRSSDFRQIAGLKRRHKLVIDDDDDE